MGRFHFFNSFFSKISLGFFKEVAILQVLKCLTVKRFINIIQTSLSFFLSAILKKNIVWGYPIILNIEPTNTCNLHCPLCTTGSNNMTRPRGKLSFELFKNVLDQIGDKILYVTLYAQGEPFLNKDINKFIKYAKDKGVYVNTSTNAHFFTTKEQAVSVVKSGLDSMIISLDGVTQESFSYYRRGGELQTVLTGIKNLVKAKKEYNTRTPFLYLQFLVMKHNEHEIPEIKKLAKELDVNRLLIKTIQVHSLEEAKEWLPQNEKLKRYHVTSDSFTVKQGKGICPRPWLTTLIDWDGLVVPCCFDKNGEFPMGNVSTSDFDSVWSSKNYQNFRKKMVKNRNSIKICKNCNYGIGLFK